MVEMSNVLIWQIMYASCTPVQGSGNRGNKIRINAYCTEDSVTQLASILKEEETRPPKTLISIYRTRGRYSPEYHILNRHYRENMKFCHS